MRNIVLLGMPGAGKSTVGVLLAKALGMPFIDTDLIIQESAGMLLQDIIDTRGIDHFLSVEERVLLNLNVKNHVIAPGGSVIYSTAVVRHLKAHGVLVYLQLPLSEIEKRLNNIRSRGIVIKKDQKLNDLFAERAPLYEKYADLIIDCEGKDMERIVSEIIDFIHNNSFKS